MAFSSSDNRKTGLFFFRGGLREGKTLPGLSSVSATVTFIRFIPGKFPWLALALLAMGGALWLFLHPLIPVTVTPDEEMIPAA